MKALLKDTDPNYEIYAQMHFAFDMPSQLTDFNEKLDAFSALLALPNSLYRVIQEYQEKSELKHGEKCVQYDLMIISQMLLDKTEQEFFDLKIAWREQGVGK